MRRAGSASSTAIAGSSSSERQARFLAPLTLALCLFGSVARAEPPDTTIDPGRAATELAAQGRWAEAAAQFRAALAQRDTPTTRFNLAQAERNSGRLATAEHEFGRARDLAREQGNYDVERLAEQALSTIRARVPKLVIEVPAGERGVDARLDGRRVTPGDAIRLDPGAHELRVTASGRKPFTRKLRLRPGEQLRVAVSFAIPPAKRPSPARAEPAAGDAGPPVLAVIGIGVGAAALTTAALLHVRRNDKLEEAARGCERSSGQYVCPAGHASDPEHRELRAAADRAELARDISIGVGVGAWTGAALVWLLGGSSSERAPDAQVSIGPTSARVSVSF